MIILKIRFSLEMPCLHSRKCGKMIYFDIVCLWGVQGKRATLDSWPAAWNGAAQWSFYDGMVTNGCRWNHTVIYHLGSLDMSRPRLFELNFAYFKTARHELSWSHLRAACVSLAFLEVSSKGMNLGFAIGFPASLGTPPLQRKVQHGTCMWWHVYISGPLVHYLCLRVFLQVWVTGCGSFTESHRLKVQHIMQCCSRV